MADAVFKPELPAPDHTGELWDMYTLLHIAIGEASECTIDSDGATDPNGMTDRQSRFVSLLCMTQKKVAALIKALDPDVT